MVAHTCYLSTGERKSGEVQGHPWLPVEFMASLVYLAKTNKRHKLTKNRNKLLSDLAPLSVGPIQGIQIL